MVFKEHEKFWAFMALGFALLVLAVVANIWPTDNETAKQVMVAAVGAFSLALGAATNALFRIREPGESRVTIDQPANQPVPVETQ